MLIRDAVAPGGSARHERTDNAATRDVGLLVSIIATADQRIWWNLEHSVRSLRPRWSSLAVDLWSRANGMTAAEARLKIYLNYTSVLSLFDRTLFLNTAQRSHIPVHVRSSFSYRLHWLAAFADPATRDPTRGPNREGLPEILMGMDADYFIPAQLPIESIANVLRRASAARQGASFAARAAETEARARSIWVNGTTPRCSALGAATHGGGGQAFDQQCEVVRQDSTPLYVCPRNLPLMRMEQSQAGGELRDALRPRKLGSCCGRQNVRVANASLLEASGASAATLSRGPWCPTSTVFLLHASSLDRHLAALRVWQDAVDRRLLRRAADAQSAREWPLLRWEYVGCSMLAKGESVMLAYYNFSHLEGRRKAHRFSARGRLLPDGSAS